MIHSSSAYHLLYTSSFSSVDWFYPHVLDIFCNLDNITKMLTVQICFTIQPDMFGIFRKVFFSSRLWNKVLNDGTIFGCTGRKEMQNTRVNIWRILRCWWSQNTTHAHTQPVWGHSFYRAGDEVCPGETAPPAVHVTYNRTRTTPSQCGETYTFLSADEWVDMLIKSLQVLIFYCFLLFAVSGFKRWTAVDRYFADCLLHRSQSSTF